MLLPSSNVSLVKLVLARPAARLLAIAIAVNSACSLTL